jgi:hypothetical protein
MLTVDLLWTTDLTPGDYADMAGLFDSEYAADWGPWNPMHGYGYAAGELHALARRDGQLLGYAATGRRFIGAAALLQPSLACSAAGRKWCLFTGPAVTPVSIQP